MIIYHENKLTVAPSEWFPWFLLQYLKIISIQHTLSGESRMLHKGVDGLMRDVTKQEGIFSISEEFLKKVCAL